MCVSCDGAMLHVHAAMAMIDPALAAKTVSEDGYPGESVDGGDPFIAEELIVAAALAAAMFTASSGLRSDLSWALSSGSRVVAEAALGWHSAKMSNLYASAKDEVERAVAAALANGLAGHDHAGAARFQSAVLRSIERAASTHYSAHVAPSIRAAIQRAADDAGIGRKPDFSELIASLDNRFHDTGYWGSVANAGVGKAYNGGTIYGLASRGIETYRFVAEIDKRTSAVCRSLNGMTWRVADAVAVLDRVAASDDPDAMRREMPFPEPGTLSSAGEIPYVPPVHFRCRSRLVAA